MKIIMTGGHHSSAMPVIHILRKDFSDVEIYWFGHKYTLKGDKNPTMEYHDITNLQIPFFELKAGKLYKTYNLGRLLKIPLGFFQALYLLIRIKPDLIVSFGGYLAVPTVLAGWLLGIPSITHEQTVVTGYANKLISKFAKKILVSWPSSAVHFDKAKVVVTGLPLREGVFKVLSNVFQVNESLPTLLAIAGKTGSHKINQAIKTILRDLLAFCNVIHVCGDNSVYCDYADLEKYYGEIKKTVPGVYIPKKFVYENEIGEAYKKSNLVLSRSGAHFVCEFVALEKPGILIPIPWVSHNEQFKNAEMFRDAGLGVIFEEKDLQPTALLEIIKKTFANISSFKLRSPELKNAINLNAANLIVNEIIKFKKT